MPNAAAWFRSGWHAKAATALEPFALFIDRAAPQFARVSKVRNILCSCLAAAAPLQAAETVIEPQTFEVVSSFEAKAMPAGPVPTITIDAKAWSTFTIRSLAAHGTAVRKGEALITFQARELDREIEDLRRALAAGALALTEATEAVAQLKETIPHQLEAARQSAAIAKEKHAYFNTTERQAQQDAADQRVKRSQQRLDNEAEELAQLKQMYQADEVTDGTEEIILTRQQNAVQAAEFDLRLTQLEVRREIEVRLPRTAIELANAERDSATALKYAERQLPRQLEEAEQKRAALEARLERQRQSLADLEHDRGLCEIKAASDGVFYHGVVADGEWTTGELLRSLQPGSQVPLHKPLASLIPNASTLVLVAHVDAATARAIDGQASGSAVFKGAEAVEIPVTVEHVGLVPETDGRYPMLLKPNWPKGIAVATGNPAEIQLLCVHKTKAIAIPAKALRFGAMGWTVEVKLADGSTERRSIKRGRRSGDLVEILSGLEPGQVVVSP